MDSQSEEGINAVANRKVGIIEYLCGYPHCLAVSPGSVRRDSYTYLERCVHDLDHVFCKAVGILYEFLVRGR